MELKSLQPQKRVEEKFPKENFIKALNFFVKLDPNHEILGNQESKTIFLRSLSFEKFKKIVIQTNGILLGKTDITQRSFDGEHVYVLNLKTGLPIYAPPFQSDKEDLLKKSFKALQGMGATKNSARMMQVAMNAIHPFGDGNGRTGRFLYLLLASTTEKPDMGEYYSPKLQQVIEKYIEEKHSGSGAPQTTFDRSKRPIFPENLKGSKEAIAIFSDFLVNDWSTMSSALQLYFNNSGNDISSILDEKGGFSWERFTQWSNITRIFRVMKIYRELKNEFVTTVIDLFEHPDAYPLNKVLAGRNDLQKELFDTLPEKNLNELFFIPLPAADKLL